jgi:hypothetical protein
VRAQAFIRLVKRLRGGGDVEPASGDVVVDAESSAAPA